MTLEVRVVWIYWRFRRSILRNECFVSFTKKKKGKEKRWDDEKHLWKYRICNSFGLKRRKIESVKQVIWNITHRVKFCTIFFTRLYFHHSSPSRLHIYLESSRFSVLGDRYKFEIWTWIWKWCLMNKLLLFNDFLFAYNH